MQASAIPPMVCGITPQGSPADTDKESKRRETPIMDQTVIERKSKKRELPQLKKCQQSH